MRDAMGEVPHIVDLPLASECEHREVIYYHASANLRERHATVHPVRLKKSVEVVDLGEVWRLVSLSVLTNRGPVRAEFSPLEESLVAAEAHRLLDDALDQIPRDLKKGKILSLLQRDIREKGKVALHLQPRRERGVDLPRCWAGMEREWVRLPVAVWKDEKGRVW